MQAGTTPSPQLAGELAPAARATDFEPTTGAAVTLPAITLIATSRFSVSLVHNDTEVIRVDLALELKIEPTTCMPAAPKVARPRSRWTDASSPAPLRRGEEEWTIGSTTARPRHPTHRASPVGPGSDE